MFYDFLQYQIYSDIHTFRHFEIKILTILIQYYRFRILIITSYQFSNQDSVHLLSTRQLRFIYTTYSFCLVKGTVSQDFYPRFHVSNPSIGPLLIFYIFQYRREIEALFENTFACESGAQLSEQKWGEKNLVYNSVILRLWR